MILTNLENTIEKLSEYNARTNNYERGWKLLRKYQDRLKEEVKLWMFVPCGSDGEILEKPKYNSSHDEILFEANFARYEKATKRVLFKNVIVRNNNKKYPDTSYVCIADPTNPLNDTLIVTIGEKKIWIDSGNTFGGILNFCGDIELTESGSKYFEI